MQKHYLIFLFSFLLIFSVSEATLAAIISLPRYQGSVAHKYTDRKESGGKDKVEITCTSRGGYAKGANQTCTGLFMVSGLTCYKSCSCNNGYKANATTGGCDAKTCSDYGLKSSPEETKSCPQVSKAPNLTCYECEACDTSVYKYTCSGTGHAASQTGTACNKLYNECKCATNYRWDSTNGKCVCDGNYIADSSGVCSLKTCKDYNSFYLTKEEKEALSDVECEQVSGLRNGLECWSCTACDSSYKYDCSSIANNNGGDGTACGGKYAKCKCKDLYDWNSDNGTCELGCTAKSCTGETSCKGIKCTVFSSMEITSSMQIGVGVATDGYKACKVENCSDTAYLHGYVVTACKTDKDGWSINSGKTNCECAYSSNDTVYKYAQSDCANASCSLGCNDKYKFNTCNSNYFAVNIGDCSRIEADCATLGYTSDKCSGKGLKCPFGNKYSCLGG